MGFVGPFEGIGYTRADDDIQTNREVSPPRRTPPSSNEPTSMPRFRNGTEHADVLNEFRHFVRLFPSHYVAKALENRTCSVTSDESKGNVSPHQFVRD